MVDAFSRFLGGKPFRELRQLWRELLPASWLPSEREVHPDLPDGELPVIRGQIRECLEARGGEVSARLRAAKLGETYWSLTSVGRERFLRLLANDFGLDRHALDHAINVYLQAGDEERLSAECSLRNALESPRKRLLTQFNDLPAGIKFLVDLRGDLLKIDSLDGSLRGLDVDLVDLLRSWFDVGFLELQRISWDSSASLLEKLIAYEAVHEIESWDDLRNRLEVDRRCYAFFHPQMPGEPLIFVEVALVDRLAGNIQALLDEDAPVLDPQQANTAIFYSISNTQAGLRGISFGSFLIKQVVDDLSLAYPGLKRFATLSPLPGFCRWLREEQQREGGPLLQAAEVEALKEAANTLPDPPQDAPSEKLLGLLLDRPDWVFQPQLASVLQAPLMRLCARYLLEAKRGNQPLDPVARFHLGNGASVEQLNWMADTSPGGLKQSAGIMVNYRYRSDEIESNHERFRTSGLIVASPQVERLARK